MTEHDLEPTPETAIDVFSRDTPPVLAVDPGDTVVVRSLDANGYLERQQKPGEVRPLMFDPRRGHCLTGPIEVRGAESGTVLAVHLVSLRPGDWGWTTAAAKDNWLMRRLGLADGPPSHLLWELDVERGVGVDDLGHSVSLAPFLGVIGLPPAAAGEHSTIPPRAEGGGNIDCRELVAGSTLYLPVTVPGALLHLGDGHAAQGDGEVGGTAIECPMTTKVALDLVTDPAVPGIHAVTPGGRITFGFHEDLNEAMAEALAAMLVWIQSLLALGDDNPKATAVAVASTAVDLRITQVANDTWGAHAVLPNGALRSLGGQVGGERALGGQFGVGVGRGVTGDAKIGGERTGRRQPGAGYQTPVCTGSRRASVSPERSPGPSSSRCRSVPTRKARRPRNWPGNPGCK
jgi:acetamidase/formamidase